MNIFKIINLGMTFYNLNKGLAEDGKAVIDEGMDVLQVISLSLKDNKITNAEKKLIVKEIREFSKAAIKAVDNIVIPE
tara:strand:+ start:2789 stop:3022 length:234 start_codon:yes stop_codon:yes gene_type:complete